LFKWLITFVAELLAALWQGLGVGKGAVAHPKFLAVGLGNCQKNILSAKILKNSKFWAETLSPHFKQI